MRREGQEAAPDRNRALRLLPRRLRAKPLVVVFVVVATTDLVFAVDSIPAIFAVTSEPFVVFAANAFAMLGLRALYFLLAGMMDRFVYLSHGLALILAFIGTKMLLIDVWHPPIWLSLGVIVAVLAATVVLSLRAEPEGTCRVTRRARIAAACGRVVESSWFDPLMLSIIAVNAVTLGLETYDSIDAAIGRELHLANDVILGLFVVELALRMAAFADRPREFFRSGWNVFDFVVIAASFVPGVRENATLLRLVRLLRIVRAVRLLPDLRVLTVAVGRSIPGVASLAAITLLLVYVYGMVGWVIFHDHDPANFEDIGQSMVTMFVLLTLENLPVYIARGQELSDWTLLFYVSYVLLASFLIFNLFIGIVINSMEEARAIELHRAERALLDDDTADDERAHAVVLEERLRAMRAALDELERDVRAKT